jgi:hypothetical protein
MYFTRFGYFVIVSIILAAIAAIFIIVWPFDESSGSDSATRPTPTEAAASPTANPIPEMAFDRVIDFATYGAVVSIEVTDSEILVNLNPGFDVSGLGTSSRTFRTTLPEGANSVEEALQAAGLAVNGENGVPVIRR